LAIPSAGVITRQFCTRAVKIAELREADARVKEDYYNLLRTLNDMMWESCG